MTLADVAQLAVALIALWVAVVAIQRDRAEVVATESGTAAGTLHVRVVNVGLRPLRIERFVQRQHRWQRFKHVGPGINSRAAELPAALEPAQELLLAVANHDLGEGHLYLEDAAGRHYRVRASSWRPRPDERRRWADDDG